MSEVEELREEVKALRAAVNDMRERCVLKETLTETVEVEAEESETADEAETTESDTEQ